MISLTRRAVIEAAWEREEQTLVANDMGRIMPDPGQNFNRSF